MEWEKTILSPDGLEPARAADAGAKRPIPRDVAADGPKVLIVASLFKLPYRVLRCVAEAGASVFVLGASAAASLRRSRYCKQFFDCTSRIDGRLNVELVIEINRIVNLHSIDLVVAGDAPATRSLVAISKVIDAPCFPMPELEVFDLLNDKWRFTQLCRDLDVLHPESRLFDTAKQLRAELDRGNVAPPLIAKPLSQDSGRGCISVVDRRDLKKLDRIDYSPIIVQEHIPGIDIGSSIFCRGGEIEAFLAHKYINATYTAFTEPEIYNSISRIARHLRLTGIFNFDMRLTSGGEVFFLECNPRAYFKVAMSMLVGVNFLGLGFPWEREADLPDLADPVSIRFPKAILASPWKLDRGSWRVLKFLIQDPIPYLREQLGLERGR